MAPTVGATARTQFYFFYRNKFGGRIKDCYTCIVFFNYLSHQKHFSGHKIFRFLILRILGGLQKSLLIDHKYFGSGPMISRNSNRFELRATVSANYVNINIVDVNINYPDSFYI